MDFLAKYSLEALGVSGIFISYVIYQNWLLQKANRDLEEYARKVNQLYQDHAVTILEALRNLQEALAVTNEVMRNIRELVRDRK